MRMIVFFVEIRLNFGYWMLEIVGRFKKRQWVVGRHVTEINWDSLK